MRAGIKIVFRPENDRISHIHTPQLNSVTLKTAMERLLLRINNIP